MGFSRVSDKREYLRDLSEGVRTAISHELKVRYPVPETLPDALLTLVNRLDDKQKQES
jgi:hypothetical protein